MEQVLESIKKKISGDRKPEDILTPSRVYDNDVFGFGIGELRKDDEPVSEKEILDKWSHFHIKTDTYKDSEDAHTQFWRERASLNIPSDGKIFWRLDPTLFEHNVCTQDLFEFYIEARFSVQVES